MNQSNSSGHFRAQVSSIARVEGGNPAPPSVCCAWLYEILCAHQFQLDCQMSEIYGHMAAYMVASKLLGHAQNPDKSVKFLKSTWTRTLHAKANVSRRMQMTGG